MATSARINAVQSPVISEVGTLMRQTPGTIPLGQGVVYYGPPPEARTRLIEALDRGLCDGYGPVEGIPELRAAFAQKLATENSIDCDPAREIVITGGSNMGFFNALLAIADVGDEIILPVPYYFNHEMAIRMLGLTPVPVATNADFSLSLPELEQAIGPRTRAIVTVSPNNPSGAVYPEHVLRAVNALCAQAGIYHISDEPYEYFLHQGTHYSPASDSASRSHTLSLFSLSKAYGFAGWRIGYMHIPPQLFEAVQKIQDTNLICPTIAAQYAALGALEAGRAYCDAQQPQISTNRVSMLASLKNLPALKSQPVADGAFYLLLNVDSSQRPMALVEALIRQYQVAAIPGDTFGLNGCYLRVAYGALDTSTLELGVARLVEGLTALA